MAFQPERFTCILDTIGGDFPPFFVYRTNDTRTTVIFTDGYFDRVEKFGAKVNSEILVVDEVHGDRFFLQVSSLDTSGTATVIAETYTGGITLSSTDDWQRVIERHDGKGIITLADGAYTAVGDILPAVLAGGRLDIRGATVGGATVTGFWDFNGISVNFANLNLIGTPTKGVARGESAFWSLTDCNIDLTTVTDTGHNGLYWYHGDVLVAAVNRQVFIDLGSFAASATEFDGGAYLKAAGNVTPGNNIVIRKRGVIGQFNGAIVLDGSGFLFAGVQLYAVKPDGVTKVTLLADRHSIGLDIRRGGPTSEIQDFDNEISGFIRGIDVEHYGQVIVDNIDFDGNTRAFRLGGVNADIVYFSGTMFNGSATPLPADIQNDGGGISVQKSTAPSFLAVPATTLANVTGDGTSYVVIFGTEIYDQSSSFSAASGIFTAPVTGLYQFVVSLFLTGVDLAHHTSFNITIGTSNGSFLKDYGIVTPDGSGNVTLPPAVAVCDMDVGDTAFVILRVLGDSKVVDVYNNTRESSFAGYLL